MDNRSIKKNRDVKNFLVQSNKVKPVDYNNANNNPMWHGNIHSSRINAHIAPGFTDLSNRIEIDNVTEEGLPFQEWAEKYHQ